jgi:hypothetical protein
MPNFPRGNQNVICPFMSYLSTIKVWPKKISGEHNNDCYASDDDTDVVFDKLDKPIDENELGKAIYMV